ncbi:DegT/DnrJ/EryC1/StrS family aminotransferase [Bacillus thuringiensis]|uniref:DegT/DnrJ/EryC1/StrS family aminotransferase n=1 Tax=Bacillus thuringiensis TaxID=1428 RepID=UPI0015D4A1DD|nr:DegT/DnrJ/EryC1/StrS family aminotransferase [Bacillus thuringiensis]
MKTWPIITEKDKKRVMECLEEGRLWRGEGKYLLEFEKAFAKMHDTKYSLAVTNGTHALEIALAALNIGPGDEVLVPAYTFIATATAVLMRNALPIPVEVNKDNYCIDPMSIEEMITPRTKAIIPVHIAGHACNMEEIMRIARKHNLKVIEDCAHAHGSKFKDKPLGSFGDFGTFSFQAVKTMTAGEGGMLITNNEQLYHKAFSFFNCGRTIDGNPYDHTIISSNYRMSEIQAALLVGQIDRLDKQITYRYESVSYLNEKLLGIKGIVPQIKENYAYKQGYSMYMFRYDGSQFKDVSKEKFIRILNEAGFEIRPTYPVFYETSLFKNLYVDNKHLDLLENKVDYKSFDFPNANMVSNNVLWLPHSFLLSDKARLDKFVDEIWKLKLEGTI